MTRVLPLARSILVSIIYSRTIELSISAVNGAAPLTLMSTDVELVCSGLKNIHETWANFIQAGIALFLLSKQLGPGSAAPVALTVRTSSPLYEMLIQATVSDYDVQSLLLLQPQSVNIPDRLGSTGLQ